MVALGAYEGAVRDLVHRAKFRSDRRLLRWAGQQLAAAVEHTRFDVVTWMPGSRSGWSDRGYTPAKVLARSLGRQCRVPVTRYLSRAADRAQVGKGRAQRLLGPSLVALDRPLQGASVLILDDVCTTGASLASAADLLLSGGAEHVHAAVMASVD
jgi:predicted amidophosphoribosyltransferase